LYEEIRPFYEELHAFVRHKLRQHYGPDKVDAFGPMPAHILGQYHPDVMLFTNS
jgi:peptidyl-dipeptidase A